MKKRLLLVGLLSLLLMIPLLGSETFSVTLNGMPYISKTPMVIRQNTPYVPLYELENLLLTTVTPLSNTRYELKVGNNNLEISMNARQIKWGQLKPILSKPALVFNGQPYVPITELLNTINYPYGWNAKTHELKLSTLSPYSINSNDPAAHTFKPSTDNLENYAKHLLAFTTPEALDKKVQNAIKEDQYLAFVDSTHRTELIGLLRENILRSPYNNISLKVREIDVSGKTPVIKSFQTLPVKLRVSGLDLFITIGNEEKKCTNYWSAFLPSFSLTQMDVNLSIDTTLMRHFYYNYRDANDLRDDKYFNSTIALSDRRTTTLRQNVYSLSSQNVPTDYEVCIYRLHPSGSLTYVIDVIKK